ncbi:hypothetical protein LSH36_564g00003 [Paralvinella palmiformis]|uniref:HAT C-terminal dimerisation domain-containing protein n=1 Tax=Paralvinella palmiformis TaxID=53620 RepID=A0AAD9MXB2_9ANNE|nr:hypothetical protein LSH36_564g00003 [Paralvinella palmiformis]
MKKNLYYHDLLNKPTTSQIRNLVHNVGLYNEAKHLEEKLKPIAAAMDSLQSNTTTNADHCEQWCAILLHTDNVLEPHKAKITKRFNQAMRPTHYLANTLHPIYRGRNLRPEHIETVQEYVLEENPELLPELCRLQTDNITLPKALVNDATRAKTKPIVWWKCIVSSESVSSLALKLLSLPASATSMERIFSNFD